jgi:hypothetical protein
MEGGAHVDARDIPTPDACLIFASGVVFIVVGTIVFKRLEPAFAKLL